MKVFKMGHVKQEGKDLYTENYKIMLTEVRMTEKYLVFMD
jgi:hypothetical protein